ncbi:MAG: dihydrodipicolinate synthase family protein [Paenibacillus sp.]|nr:dihydrodipicolinate synthase family protein [Paenibacillus sp.]
MKSGFYPALGTPLDERGQLVAASYQLHVEQQVNAGAQALLAMGSMGQQAMIKNSEYAKTARMAVDAAKGKCPVLIGVMDNSVQRVLDRIDSLSGLGAAGVVATTPYYSKLNQAGIKQFFTKIADASPYPVYMYDLPSVTQVKIEPATVVELMEHGNIAGIKTGDLVTARLLQQQMAQSGANFQVMFSGLDVFDVAYGYGITRLLDGMFSCTATIAAEMNDCLARGDQREAAHHLDQILLLRNTFVSVGVLPGFTHAMNLLGFAGTFHADYERQLNGEQQESVKARMQQLRLI